MRRVALYGGSFNPIHLGHIAVAKSVIDQRLCDEVWLMVSPQNPLKPSANLLPEQDRLDMARMAVMGMEGVKVSDFEFNLPRPSYTWRTVQALEAACPGTSFTVLIGSDNWLVFDRWARHDVILRRYGLIVYPRSGYDVTAKMLPPEVHLLNVPKFDYDSTTVRQLVRQGEDVSSLVPRAVAETIRARHFYAAPI